MKLLLDQGVPRDLLGLLRTEGIDVVHTGEIGMARSSDLEIIESARSSDRIVVTLDADFHSILAIQRAQDPSVIRLRLQNASTQTMAKIITELFKTCEEELAAGCAISVTTQAIRLHLLPLPG